MDPTLELKKMSDRVKALPSSTRLVAGVGAALLVLGVVVAYALSNADGGNYEVVFAKLTPDDGAASGDALRAAGIPFRIEAAGDAISVPSGKVHDARLLLAAQGLPRAGGVGFELFDKSDLGVSEFTQRVNLQRALEGELSRTIGDMRKVRDARVHITMPKRGLLRTDDMGASAAVMLTLESGRTLDAKEIAGVRHLIAAAVPELSIDRVTIIDQNGSMLGAADGDAGESGKKLEQELEARVVAMLEPALGRGAVVARVTAEMDIAEQDSTESLYNPDRSALRSDHIRTEATSSTTGDAAGLAGAAANQPESAAGGNATAANGRGKTSNIDDRTHTFEVSGSVTRRVSHEPRLVKLSVAVLVDAKGKPVADAEMKKLTELAKRAVGFDEERGDLLELSSASFLSDPAVPDAPLEPPAGPFGLPPGIPVAAVAGGAIGLLLAGAALAFALTRGRRKSRINELGDGGGRLRSLGGASSTTVSVTASDGGALTTKELTRAKAQEMAAANPERVAMILEAWLADDPATANASSAKEHVDG